MRQLSKFVKVPLVLSAAAVAAMLAGSTGAKAEDWHNGYNGGGYYHHVMRPGRYDNGYYYHDWHHRHPWAEPGVSVYYGPSDYHNSSWGHRRYYWYNGNRWYIDVNTGIRVEL